MRRSILTFVLCTLCLCSFSQEAFYIYRNDGDFNGFFYDEVVEMRYSKIGFDSIETIISWLKSSWRTLPIVFR